MKTRRPGSFFSRPRVGLQTKRGPTAWPAKRKSSCSAAVTKGVDERVKAFIDEEISVGDYTLSGGEPAAKIVIDAVARLVPGVLGNENSAAEESFSDRPARIPAIHPAGRVPRHEGSRSAVVGRPRTHQSIGGQGKSLQLTRKRAARSASGDRSIYRSNSAARDSAGADLCRSFASPGVRQEPPGGHHGGNQHGYP